VYEIVINGLSEAAIIDAVRAGVDAAAGPGIVAISTARHGGKLAGRQLRLRAMMKGAG